MSGKTNGKSGRGEVIYKFCLGLFIAALMVALYFNNEAQIQRMADKARARQAEQTSAAAGGDAETERSRGFTLYDRDGAETEFSSFRGEIVFVTFWTPRDARAAADMAAATDELTAAAAEAAGDIPVRLLWVLTPERTTPDSTAAAALPEDLSAVYESLGGAADTDTGHFVDGDARLARTFNVEIYPSTYVFDADGGLRDYQTGAPDAARMREMAENAAGGAH